MKNPSFRYTVIYLTIGIVWTITTNALVYYFAPHSNTFTLFFLRSLLFVILSGIGVYLVFRGHYRAYHTAERKYEHLFQNYPQPMWVYDTETYRFLKVNRAAIEKYGYSEKEFSQITLLNLFPVKEMQGIKNHIEGIKTRQFNDGIIATHFKKNGSTLFVNISSFLTTFENRNARMVTAVDISPQMEAEIKLETLLNNSDDLVWLLNRKGKLVTWNRSFSDKYTAITGLILNQEAEVNLFQLAETESIEKWQGYFAKAMQGEHLKVEETAGKGEPETYEVIIEPIIHEQYGSLGVGCFARDITLRKKNENDIKEKIKQLKEITWVQSHELRRPLSNILGLVELIKTTPFHNAEELTGMLSQLEKSSIELDSIVRQIVDKSSQTVPL
jgi:PAS domain S-box-containing protein